MNRISRISQLRAIASVKTGIMLTAAYVGMASEKEGVGPERGRGQEAYTIAMFGDMRYNALGRAQYPALLADINAHHVAFSVFDGDLKSGGDGPCADSALVHGDSHYFKVDTPLNGPAGGVLANFTRVETFGVRNTHWVSATIDPSDPKLFVFEPRIVAANAR